MRKQLENVSNPYQTPNSALGPELNCLAVSVQTDGGLQGPKLLHDYHSTNLARHFTLVVLCAPLTPRLDTASSTAARGSRQQSCPDQAVRAAI